MGKWIQQKVYCILSHQQNANQNHRDSISPQSGCCHEVILNVGEDIRRMCCGLNELSPPPKAQAFGYLDRSWQHCLGRFRGVAFLEEACYFRRGFEVKGCTYFWFPLSASCLWLGFEHSASSPPTPYFPTTLDSHPLESEIQTKFLFHKFGQVGGLSEQLKSS